MATGQPKPIRVQILEPTSYWAYGVLNPDAFETRLREVVLETAHHLAICLGASFDVRNTVPRPEQLLTGVTVPDGQDVTPPQDRPLVLVYEASSFVGGLYGLLVTAKSTLDSLAKLVTTALAPAEALGAFNKASFTGKGVVAGGRLLAWLEKHARRSGQVGRTSEELLGLFVGHVERWADTAVSWRDAALHKGGIKKMIPMQAAVTTSVRALQAKDVVGPLMPNRVPVADYSVALITNLTDLVRTSIRMLPNVDVAKLSSLSVPEVERR